MTEPRFLIGLFSLVVSLAWTLLYLRCSSKVRGFISRCGCHSALNDPTLSPIMAVGPKCTRPSQKNLDTNLQPQWRARDWHQSQKAPPWRIVKGKLRPIGLENPQPPANKAKSSLFTIERVQSESRDNDETAFEKEVERINCLHADLFLWPTFYLLQPWGSYSEVFFFPFFASAECCNIYHAAAAASGRWMRAFGGLVVVQCFMGHHWKTSKSIPFVGWSNHNAVSDLNSIKTHTCDLFFFK